MNRDTICVQGGYTPGNGEPRQIPIIQSTTFKYATSEDMGKLFDLEADGYFYSRLQNPTCDLVAKKICELEGGTAAMLTSSGQAANFFALFNLCEAGDHIVASSTIYGGTFNLISVTMKKMGIEATFVDPLCTEEELNAAFRPNTKVVFGETIANPALTVLDIEKFAKAAHAHGVPLIVDNTFPTPVNCRPFEWGADIVTHSTTKYMDGHGAVLGGAIVDGGKFDWMAHAEKFPGLCTPDDSYHGITYAERFGKEGAFITKATAQLMRDFGSMQSPMNAYMLNLGLESLHVRMQRHCANGMAVAEFLESHPKVAYVNYCGLESSPYHALAEKYLPNGSCGVVSFGLAGGREAASIFMKNLKLAAIETHVADARTCCLNPASSTHRQMNDEQLKAAGVPAELVRMSCGLESSEDLIADIAQALDKISKVSSAASIGSGPSRKNAFGAPRRARQTQNIKINSAEDSQSVSGGYSKSLGVRTMPLIIPKTLPAYDALYNENIFVMHRERALAQHIRPLEILILNLMPTKITTETQVARLLANTPLQVHMTLLQTASHAATHVSAAHLESFYKNFNEVKNNRYDGMIITGAPVETMDFEQVDYWPELCEIMDFSETNVYSTLHVCWGAQAGLYYHYGVHKQLLPEKMFGVFEHRVTRPSNPLVRGFDEVFYAPHSRHTGISREDVDNCKALRILAESDAAGPFLMSTENGRQIFVTGHPEYDKYTLDSEYRRDVDKGLPIHVPVNYYPDDDPTKPPLFRWRAHAHLLYENWLNYYVYQNTPYDLGEIQRVKHE